MSDSPLRVVPTQTGGASPPAEETQNSREATAQEADLETLRRILLEPEQLKINNLLERLNNPRVRSRETSRILTEAIRLRNAQDKSLEEALSPTIVSSFQRSVRKDPKPVADAISPIMGPAIRRYISVMLNGMVQSFDQALKNSLSWQGLKWRLEAARTGKSFAEVVIMHTLLYRAEQVFLIHKPGGIKLAHVSSPLTTPQDADIVSGMMTAIQDAIKSFARDSFGSSQDETIDTLDLGDREVWFEAGPRAVLAVVIRGKAPERLRSDFFAPAIEAIHTEMGEALSSYDGDNAPFEMARPHMESCLQQQLKYESKGPEFKIPFYLKALALLLIVGGVVWAALSWRQERRWNQYLEILRRTPGVVITDTGVRDGKRFVTGLRDPLAEDPEKILREKSPLDPAKIDAGQWTPYQSFEPLFIERRARQLLEPPPGVELNFSNGTLSAKGPAPQHWAEDARRVARLIPGVQVYNDQGLVNEGARRIESQVIRYGIGEVQPLPGQEKSIETLASDILILARTARAAGRLVQVEIVGHTDSEGDDSVNQKLSDDRALKIMTLLVSKGVSADVLTARGASSREPLSKEIGEPYKQQNRCVTFKVRSPTT
jgi:hypothetical protein